MKKCSKCHMEKEFSEFYKKENGYRASCKVCIIPISSAKTEEEIIKLHHYTNYQPLDSKINIIDKKDKLDFNPVDVSPIS